MAIQRRIKDDHMLTYLPICAGLDFRNWWGPVEIPGLTGSRKEGSNWEI